MILATVIIRYESDEVAFTATSEGKQYLKRQTQPHLNLFLTQPDHFLPLPRSPMVHLENMARLSAPPTSSPYSSPEKKKPNRITGIFKKSSSSNTRSSDVGPTTSPTISPESRQSKFKKGFSRVGILPSERSSMDSNNDVASRPGTARSSLAKQEDELKGVSAPHSLDTTLEPAATSVVDASPKTLGVERLSNLDAVVRGSLEDKDVEQTVIYHGPEDGQIVDRNQPKLKIDSVVRRSPPLAETLCSSPNQSRNCASVVSLDVDIDHHDFIVPTNNKEGVLQRDSTDPASKGSAGSEKQSPVAVVASLAGNLGDTLKQAVPLTKETVKSLGDKLSQLGLVQATSSTPVTTRKGSPVISITETEDGHKVVKVGSYYVLPEKITNISIRVLSALYMVAVIVAAVKGPSSLFKLIWRCWILCMLYEFVVDRFGLKNDLPELFLELHLDLLDVLAEGLAGMMVFKDHVFELAREKQAARLHID
ncbi:hypothetical protein K491DRAFT_684045 [Lophiostoma macrostomum CBS 122681]|uniref:Uncharacterized protein n=1 Tax=Lophiostoma macrostomum CBS 122681 TaxID=1314788 RepID=A0A6A6SMT1_9PLEO|nr:hypothetical protein K491DRAFT_684045 [Lophiostoma macrostomum CBS 122681]